LQLRKAIRLKIGSEAANCLAIPQPNESGDWLDWYAPLEGDVVPWSAASEAERAQAYTQLERLHEHLLSTANSMRDDENREKQLFARLLDMTKNFPGSSHVYLVDGKPVVTFWGFTDRAGSYEHDPLFCLRPLPPAVAVSHASYADQVMPPAATPSAPAVQATPPVPAVTNGSKRQSDSRWRRWLWLLLLPLLLLSLLFLLRACAPQVSLPLGLNRIGLPGLPAPAVDANGRAGGMLGIEANEQRPGWKAGAEGTDIGAPGGQPVEQPLTEDQKAARGQALEQAPTGDQKIAGEQPVEPGGKPEVPAGDPQLGEPPPSQNPPPDMDIPQSEPGIPPPELNIPPQALEKGSLDFLNGRWKAGAGIQDAQTGKPLRLDYEFQNGKGQVRVLRGDGVECSGPVTAEMRDGGLAITSQKQARCNDGGNYRLPEVLCKPGSQSATDCSGNYQNQQFPMSMRQDIQ
jgi:hypothetical protein